MYLIFYKSDKTNGQWYLSPIAYEHFSEMNIALLRMKGESPDTQYCVSQMGFIVR